MISEAAALEIARNGYDGKPKRVAHTSDSLGNYIVIEMSSGYWLGFDQWSTDEPHEFDEVPFEGLEWRIAA